MSDHRPAPAASQEEEEDHYLEDGLLVFTSLFHRKRGHCCQSGCRHCPWGYKKPTPPAAGPEGHD